MTGIEIVPLSERPTPIEDFDALCQELSNLDSISNLINNGAPSISGSYIFSKLDRLHNRIEISIARGKESRILRETKKQLCFSFSRIVYDFYNLVELFLVAQGKCLSYEVFDDNSHKNFLAPINALTEIHLDELAKYDGSDERKKEELQSIVCDMLSVFSEVAKISSSRGVLKARFAYDLTAIVELLRTYIINENR